MILWTSCNDRSGGFATLRTAALLLWLALVPAAVRAGALDGTLEVKSAYVSVDKGVFELHSRIQYPVNEHMRTALRDGVTLIFDLDVNVTRERHYWFDAEVANLQLRRELAYHTVSDRFVVRDARGGEQESFATLEGALEYLGSVDGWPILVTSQLNPRSDYRVGLRASVRRGRMPDTLRTIMFWTNDWHRSSEWYTWSLPQ